MNKSLKKGIAFFAIISLLLVLSVQAADTGVKVTGTVESVGLWNNLTTTRLNTSDNSRAALAQGEENSFGILSDFNFGIPEGATIDGIEISIESRTTNTFFGGTTVMTAALSWDNGSTWTSNKTADVTTTESVRTFGGSADTWGRTWDDAELADGTFQLRVSASSIPALESLNIDYLSATVYYTEASGETPINGTVSIKGSNLNIKGTDFRVK